MRTQALSDALPDFGAASLAPRAPRLDRATARSPTPRRASPRR
ncbi:hypothetical protein [Aliihoeflea sp. 2WW]|nr:hypothetical protein [Aliihoeflea sp. 2WW]